MTEVRLRAVTGRYGHTAALHDGRVRPQGFTLAFEDYPVIIQAFRRMVRSLEFDVCEMAFTTYLCAREHGVSFTALPIVLARGFHHGAAIVNTSGPVKTPRDLEGRRVGVNRGYTVTTGVWMRGILVDEYGVDLDKVTWVPSGDEHVAQYRPPANVAPLDPGADLEELVSAGTLVAAVGLDVAARQDTGSTHLARLIPDADQAAVQAFRQRGFWPINHVLVVRDDVLAAHPDLPAALFEAYSAAKQPYLAMLAGGSIPEGRATANDHRYRAVQELAGGGDPLPYGVAPNREMIDTLVGYAYRQHIIDRKPAAEEIFAKQSWDLVG